MITRLAELESRIERGFAEIGACLQEISDNKLYRESGFHSFKTYCRGRWNMDHKHAYRLMEAARVTQLLSPNHDTLPALEGHARALLGLTGDPDKLNQVWDEVVKTAPNGKITARHIKETRERLTKPKRTVTLDPDEVMGDSCMNTDNMVRAWVVQFKKRATDTGLSDREKEILRELLEATSDDSPAV